MTVSFNPQKLEMFRNAQFESTRSIANLDGASGLKSNKTLGIWRLFRSNKTTEANNAVRAELLKSLGQSFGLSGMSEKNGRVTFSKEFMTKLEKILGADVLKTADFKIEADGMVSSGKPLTSRRITAILNKAFVAGKTDDFNVDIYKMKMDAIKKDLGLAGLSEKQLQKVLKDKPYLGLFLTAEKGLDFLKNDLFLARTVIDPETKKPVIVFGEEGSKEDKSFIRMDPGYQKVMAKNNDDDDDFSIGNVYQVKNLATGEYEEYNGAYKDNYLKKKLDNALIHTETVKFDSDTSKSIEPMKKYIYGTVQLFARKMIDVYFKAKELGKLDEFMKHLNGNAGACMEEKGKRLIAFEESITPKDGLNAPSAGEAAELERIAKMNVGNNAPPPKPEDLLYDAIDALNKTDEKYNNSEDWNDFSEPIKEKLLGKTVQITIPVKNDKGYYDFIEAKKDGKPIVRPLTAEDIDTIGKACLFNSGVI